MTTSAIAARITSPPASFFKFPPDPLPATLPPPPDRPAFAHPFIIPKDIYNGFLSAEVPIAVALIYYTLVTYLNGVNARRKYKPWAFSQTNLFHVLVLVHNIFLAIYSGWTCLGMINALRLSVYDWRGEWGLAGTLDSLCKIHGPRGLGDAATYNATTSLWGLSNPLLHLGPDTLTPDSTDVGRIWNEGLAFYGWLFYVSKFYETLDTFIILAKGKKSSFLQTYHHTGAMICMWAGIRYMSPPIWMFVMVNSGLHAIMYTYYTLTTLSIKVPKWFKQTLTTLQIMQFVVGASYAFAHLFVAYQIPVSVPYLYHLGESVASVPQDLSSAVSVATATATAGAAAWLKKAALRAAGQEGLAQNVLNEQGETFGIDAVHAAQDFQARTETRYRDEIQWVHCLDTSGEAFAIWLNCLYLAPLTWLFIKFFITAYLKRQERRRSSAAAELARAAGYAGHDAFKGVARHISEVATEGAADKQPDHHQEQVKREEPNLRERDGGDEIAVDDEGGRSSVVADNHGGDADEKKTPELQQGDSFVKVDQEPESPTEVRSFGDEEEAVVDKDEDEIEEKPGEESHLDGQMAEDAGGKDRDVSEEPEVEQNQTAENIEGEPPSTETATQDGAVHEAQGEPAKVRREEDPRTNGPKAEPEENEPVETGEVKESDDAEAADAKTNGHDVKAEGNNSAESEAAEDSQVGNSEESKTNDHDVELDHNAAAETETAHEPNHSEEPSQEEVTEKINPERDEDSHTASEQRAEEQAQPEEINLKPQNLQAEVDDDNQDKATADEPKEKQDKAIEAANIEPLAPPQPAKEEKEEPKTNGEAHDEGEEVHTEEKLAEDQPEKQENGQ